MSPVTGSTAVVPFAGWSTTLTLPGTSGLPGLPGWSLESVGSFTGVDGGVTAWSVFATGGLSAFSSRTVMTSFTRIVSPEGVTNGTSNVNTPGTGLVNVYVPSGLMVGKLASGLDGFGAGSL